MASDLPVSALPAVPVTPETRAAMEAAGVRVSGHLTEFEAQQLLVLKGHAAVLGDNPGPDCMGRHGHEPRVCGGCGFAAQCAAKTPAAPPKPVPPPPLPVRKRG